MTKKCFVILSGDVRRSRRLPERRESHPSVLGYDRAKGEGFIAPSSDVFFYFVKSFAVSIFSVKIGMEIGIGYEKKKRYCEYY